MDCNINVIMFGGRRCGKTSVIAAMKTCFQNVCGENSDIVISIPEPSTFTAINEKCTEIERYFNNQTQGIVFDSSIGSTTGWNNLISLVEKLKRTEMQHAKGLKLLLKKLNHYFGNIASANDFLKQKSEIREKLKTDELFHIYSFSSEDEEGNSYGIKWCKDTANYYYPLKKKTR